MAKTRNLKELINYLRGLDDIYKKAHTLALIETVTLARGKALRNATKEFIGRNDRKLSGNLFKSIFSGYDFEDKSSDYPVGYIGTRGIPYGAIHEYGGVIRPVKAKNLWIKNYSGVPGMLKRMTPTEFFNAKKADPRSFRLIKSTAFFVKKISIRSKKEKWIPLFFLVKKVKMPKRSYLRPAVNDASKGFGALARKRFAELVVKG